MYGILFEVINQEIQAHLGLFFFSNCEFPWLGTDQQ